MKIIGHRSRHFELKIMTIFFFILFNICIETVLLSGRVLDLRLGESLVRASPEALLCVLEKDTLTSA